MPTGVFNICCPRDCVSRHNGGTSGALLKPLRVDSALRALSTLRGLRGAPDLLSERRSLSDSKCWNLVAKTQRWEQMGCEVYGRKGCHAKSLYYPINSCRHFCTAVKEIRL